MIVGVLGGGQLGRMLALAGYPLGLRFRFLDPAPEAPAAHLAERLPVDDYENLDALKRFAHGLTVVTYEFENVPLAAARFLEERVPVYPPPAALEVSQERLAEKTFFQQLGIPVPPFASVDSPKDLTRALKTIGLPAVLKTRRFGYDGKGQIVLREEADARELPFEEPHRPLILEGFVPFTRELSLLSVRGRDGSTVFYPLVENHHRDGILRLTLAPAPDLDPQLQAEAEAVAAQALEALNYVGVLAIEFFEHAGRLLVNEMAPRVHNSGHWTIEGAETSQFENHLRAILGYPLGATDPVGCSAMVNLIGDIPDPAALLAIPHAHLHRYGKTSRPGRKVGHITLRTPDRATLAQEWVRLQQLLAEE